MQNQESTKEECLCVGREVQGELQGMFSTGCGERRQIGTFQNLPNLTFH